MKKPTQCPETVFFSSQNFHKQTISSDLMKYWHTNFEKMNGNAYPYIFEERLNFNRQEPKVCSNKI